MLQISGRDAFPVIGDAHVQARRPAVRLIGLGADANVPTRIQRVDGIGENVQKDLLQAARVGGDDRGGGVQLAFDPDALGTQRRGEERERLLDQARDGDWFPLEARRSGLIERVTDCLAHDPNLRLDDRELLASVGGRDFLGQQLGVAEHGIEGGAELVRDRCRHLTECGQSLGTTELLLHVPELFVDPLQLEILGCDVRGGAGDPTFELVVEAAQTIDQLAFLVIGAGDRLEHAVEVVAELLQLVAAPELHTSIQMAGSRGVHGIDEQPDRACDRPREDDPEHAGNAEDREERQQQGTLCLNVGKTLDLGEGSLHADRSDDTLAEVERCDGEAQM